VLSKSLDGAAVDVQAAITKRPGCYRRVCLRHRTFTKVNPADQPILISPSLPRRCRSGPSTNRETRNRAAHLHGERVVAQVQVLGAQKYAVHVQVDPHVLASRQIGINEVELRSKIGT